MISTLHIEGYRGFDRFDMDHLGRINLLVGKNNSGKTSILEAVYLLFSGGSPASLVSILWNRGERLPNISPIHGNGSSSLQHVELAVQHLFAGHRFASNAYIAVSASEESKSRELRLTLIDSESYVSQGRDSRSHRTREANVRSEINVEVTGNPEPDVRLIHLTDAGGLDSFVAQSRFNARQYPAKFIFINSISSDHLVTMWNGIALTPTEDVVLKALQAIDPGIERIATQVGGPIWTPIGRDGFVVKQKGIDQPVPIGSMGDGMWRMLAMAIAISQCQGGVLLVDEIDTGLHYSVMLKMWTLIYSAARELDVQVFATTHSEECVHSLSQIGLDSAENSISVQRIEPGKKHSVPFDREEVAAAASSDVEIR